MSDNMDQFFYVAYRRPDRERIRPFIEDLKRRALSIGFDLWWDDSLRINDLWHSQLSERHYNAISILGIFSEHSHMNLDGSMDMSRFIYLGELNRAFTQNRLVALGLPGLDINKLPIGHDSIQIEYAQCDEEIPAKIELIWKILSNKFRAINKNPELKDGQRLLWLERKSSKQYEDFHLIAPVKNNAVLFRYVPDLQDTEFDFFISTEAVLPLSYNTSTNFLLNIDKVRNLLEELHLRQSSLQLPEEADIKAAFAPEGFVPKKNPYDLNNPSKEKTLWMKKNGKIVPYSVELLKEVSTEYAELRLVLDSA